MKKLSGLLSLAFCLCSCTVQHVSDAVLADKALRSAEEQLSLLRNEAVARNGLPRTVEDNRIHWTDEINYIDWTEGFFPGTCWYMYEYTQDEQWKKAADQLQSLCEKDKLLTTVHDLGFIFQSSYGNGLRLTGDSTYKEVLLTAARSLSTRFNPLVGCIQSWDVDNDSWQSYKGWQYPVIIDNMLNLELLFNATILTGDSSFYHIAVSHADKTMENHFRPDNSCFHVVDYDSITGNVHVKQTAQGYADESSWARGQAWALYGYMMCYRYTGEQRYLDQTIKVADYIIRHPSIPKDHIPYWDYNVAELEQQPRDASAAAVTASALLELSHYEPSYKEYAVSILRSLSSPAYSAALGKNNYFLLMHNTGSVPHNAEIDAPLNYADYYYVEALMRLKELSAQEPVAALSPGKEAIRKYRSVYAKEIHHVTSLVCPADWKECLALLDDNGQFKDLKEKEREYTEKNLFQSHELNVQQEIGVYLTDIFNRLWKIAEHYRLSPATGINTVSPKYWKAIAHYGKMETGRINEETRFHASCFAIPTAAVNIYFSFLPLMDRIEAGGVVNPGQQEACRYLKLLGMQAWTQPFRGDKTDEQVVQVERFRNHVWWVGGNALSYRPLLPVALMMDSVEMIDVISEVAQRSISTVSQQTYDEAFWTEGLTADGAGWGHGKQCLIWGYPIHGTDSALELLDELKGSPWERTLSSENTQALMNFFRGSSWYYYKGFVPPCVDRYSMRYYGGVKRRVPYAEMLDKCNTSWADSFTEDERRELKKLEANVEANCLMMDNQPSGIYTGTRWFYNNDDLIKKNKNYYILVNMASVRCDGLESACEVADGYNLFTNDGLTLFERSGDEYNKVLGAWDLTLLPGITAREGCDRLNPITNWRGYCSSFNYAGAATSGKENAVAGFIFEKLNGSDKENVNDRGSSETNHSIFGVKAYKSYFMLGDYFVALGAGVTNLRPEITGTIRTAIDQTFGGTGSLSVLKDGKRQAFAGQKTSFISDGKPVWLLQEDAFAYTILPQYTRNAYFERIDRPTRWEQLNPSNKQQKNLPPSADLLQLWVDHGDKPVEDTYGYVVYCGDNRSMPAELPFEVLRNDTAVQAIQSADKRVTEVVFYQKNERLQASGLTLTASEPCVVLLEQESSGNYTLSVTDPTMNPAIRQITLNLSGKDVVVDMPQGKACGSVKVVNVVD